VRNAIIGVLEPYMSGMVASTFVSATAISLHKSADDLCLADYPVLEGGLRDMLTPVASPALVSQTLADVRACLPVSA
jgi:hypothetical protein